MGFASLTGNLVVTAMGLIGDLASSGTYRDVTATVYDPNLGANVPSFTDIPIPAMVFSRFKIEEKDSQVLTMRDMKVIIPGNYLQITPTINDQVITTDGRTFNVQRDLTVPGSSVYIIHVREA